MGADRSFTAGSKEVGTTAQHPDAPSCQRPVVPVDDGLSVAPVTERIPAVLDGTAVFLPMAGCRAMADDQSFSGDADARGSRSGSQPHRRGPRQPVGQTTEAAGPRGYDAGKKIKGRKRHVLTDTNGLLVAAVVHQADIQDRDGAPLVLASARYLYPWLRHAFAMAAIAAPSSTPLWKKSTGGGSRSSSAPMPPRGSSFCRGAGLSSAPLLGSIVTDASPKTLKPPWKVLWRGCF